MIFGFITLKSNPTILEKRLIMIQNNDQKFEIN